MRKSVKRAAVITTALALTAGGATAAWAAWNATGSGTATAKAGTAVELKTSVAKTEATLFPGITGDAYIKVVNDNPYPVRLDKIAKSGDISASGGIGTCINTGVYFGDFSKGGQDQSHSTQSVFDKNLVVPAKGSAEFTLTMAVRMINNSENGCQGATFSIPVSLTGFSAAS
jgi:hypothetical protein